MGEELPEELRWRGHVSDDDDDEDDVFGGDEFAIHGTKDHDYNLYDEDDYDDPLGGASVLGGDGLSLGGAGRPGSSSSVEEEDFVKILQESIERDLPKCVFIPWMI
jgi:hypothetical protein